MYYPLWKNANFSFLLNPCLYCLERLVCCIKRGKSFFDDLFSRPITWRYRGLQGVTEGYRGLQGLTEGYKGLHGFTRGDSSLQGVTGVTKVYIYYFSN